MTRVTMTTFMTVDVQQAPRVFVPPPLIIGAGWLASWGASSRMPFEIDGAGASVVQLGLGVVFLSGGLGLSGWALLTLVRAGTAILPIRPARVVVMGGPYGWSRNPIYLGLIAAYVGLAAVLNQAWPLVFLPVVLLMLAVWVIEPEERHLAARFGEAYAVYCRRVRRWL